MWRLCIVSSVFVLLARRTSCDDIYTSIELINDALITLRNTEFYEDLEDIMVKFVMHFEYNETMTIKTKYGSKKLKRDEDILNFDEFLIHSTVAIEDMRKQVMDVSFRFDYPMHAYRFIRNNTIVLQTIIKKMRSTFERYEDLERADLMKALKKYTEIGAFPKANDLKGVTEALIDLQEIYSLTATDIADGIFFGDRSQSLNAEESYTMAKFAKNEGKVKLYVSWLEVAKQRLESENDGPEERLFLYQRLDEAYNQAGCQCVQQAHDNRARITELLPDNTEQISNNEGLCEEINLETCVQKLTKAEKSLTKHPKDIDLNFRKLCQSVTHFQSATRFNKPKQTSDLSCKYERTKNLFYHINPFRIEILNRKPSVLLVHELIDISTTELLIHHGVSNLQVEHSKNITMTLKNKVRARATTMKSKRQLKLVTSIQQKVASISQTELKSSSNFFLVNYGIVGYDKPRTTYTTGERNNHAVSMTIFLTKLKMGGEIVFPHLGLSVKPVERNALLVFQGPHSPTGSDITLHGACPVVKGNKWIATQMLG